MPYQQLIDDCLAARIGEGGLSDEAFAAALAQTAPALDELRKSHGDGSLPLLGLPARHDDLRPLADVAQRMRSRFDEIVVLGTGGSSLGGQTVAALADPGAVGPRLHFADNVDPHTFAVLLDRLDPRRTGFLVVTKSGSTAETLTQMLICLDRLRSTVRKEAVADHFVLISEPGDSPLRRLSDRWGLTCLDHDPGVGGRYSVLSLVGLLPAMIAGLDGAAVRAGAAQVLDAMFRAGDPRAAEPAVGAAISIGLLRERGAAITVLVPYIDRLATFGLWFRQLWAESLGKDGTGTTPIRAAGAVDQHSQLQLYLAGPRDKMFTLIALDGAGTGPRVAADLADDTALAYLRGKSMGDLLDAEQRATADTLARNGRPVRVFRLKRLDESTLGALFMHFMLETIIAAHLLGVDPFDQPAVEEGKVLARAYLEGREPHGEVSS